MLRFLRIFIAITLILSAVNLCQADHWNQFRGPGGSGIADGCSPPVRIGEDSLTWRVEVPQGHSSPALSTDHIFLTAIEDDRLITLAFEKETGRLAWRKEAPKVKIERIHETSSPASSTPYVDTDRVIVYFGSFGLICYDLDGKELWQREIPTPRSLYGMATSPIVHGENIILVLDDENNIEGGKLSQSKVIAVSKQTGETVWETARPFNRSGWSTPMIWNHDGGQDLVVLGNWRLYGYDPKNGEERWFTEGFAKETIAVPVAGDGKLYASASMLGGAGDEQPDPTPFWESVLQFDKNGDGRFGRDEISHYFTFPLRPELPLGHPGYGFPLPGETDARRKRQEGYFSWVDDNKDGFWTKEELVKRMAVGRGRPVLLAIRPGGSGDVTESHAAWEVNRNIPEIPSPVYYDGRVYMVRDGGILSSVDTADGSSVYRKRLNANGHYSASPVVASGNIYLVSNKGEISVVKSGDDFVVLHEHDLSEVTYATPAIDRSTIYFRTANHLAAYRQSE